MEVEDYFEFDGPNDIRIRGTRIGIETVIREHRLRRRPEQIVEDYPALTLEQVNAAILYYLHNPERMNGVLEELEVSSRDNESLSRDSPSPTMRRLREVRRLLEELPPGAPESERRRILGQSLKEAATIARQARSQVA